MCVLQQKVQNGHKALHTEYAAVFIPKQAPSSYHGYSETFNTNGKGSYNSQKQCKLVPMPKIKIKNTLQVPYHASLRDYMQSF